MTFPAKSLGFGCLGLAALLVAEDFRNPRTSGSTQKSFLPGWLSPGGNEPKQAWKPTRSTFGDVSLATNMKRTETFQIQVKGQVTQPGLVTVTARATINDAVSLAGGITESGSSRRVNLLRGGLQEICDMTRSENADARLEEGDIIFVPEKNFNFSE